MVSTNEAAARTGMASSGAEFALLHPELVTDGRVDLDALVGEPTVASFELAVLEHSAL